MDLNQIISSVGFSLGIVQMFDQLKTAKKKVEDKKMLYLTLAATVLWAVYQFRKLGMQFTTVYTLIGLAVQIYVLKQILDQD
jgi:hypothetical protein|tara:strand:- start:6473 stop:6718 length:246 start_codon:yes stop_codon:yes gene_type:complete